MQPMNLSSSTMSMATFSTEVAKTTSTAAAATSSAMNSMSMDMSNSCKISMLWNWYTIDACMDTLQSTSRCLQKLTSNRFPQLKLANQISKHVCRLMQ